MDNVAGLAAFGAVKNYDGGTAPHPCVALMGATPSYGELQLFFPSDARPWCSADGYFAVRQMLLSEDVESLPQRLRYRRSAVERGLEAGTCSSQPEFDTGRPIRFYMGGVGGNRLLGMRPIPVTHVLWRTMDFPIVEARDVRMDLGGARCSGLRNLPQRAKPPSAGGDVDVYCSRSSVTVRTDSQIPLSVMLGRAARVAPVKSGIAYIFVWASAGVHLS